MFRPFDPWFARASEQLTVPVRLSAFYGALFLIYGVQLAYLPVWLDSKGLGPTGISIATSLALFIRLFVTPGAAFLADHTRRHAGIAFILACIALASLIGLTVVDGFAPIVLFVTLLLLSTQTVMPLTETIAMAQVRLGRIDYGRVRLWGSLTFVVANMIAGLLVDGFGPGAVLWILMTSAIATVIAGSLLPEIASGMNLQRKALSIDDAFALITKPWFQLLMLASGAVQAAHAMFYVFGVLHWRASGLDAFETGSLWAIAVAVEVLLFARSATVLKFAGPFDLIFLGAAAAVLRWTWMAFDPPIAVLILLQAMHALTYAATHLGTMHAIGRAVPEHQAGTAQALVATINAGVLMGGAMLASAPLYATWHGGGYLGMAILAGVGAVAAHLLRRNPPASAP